MTRENRKFLTNRTALVTGGGKRIGRTLVSALARAGATVVIHHHTSGDDARATAAGVEVLGGRAFLIDGDLADPRVAAALCERARDRCGGALDILVNNASVFAPGDAATTTCEQWDAHHAVNLRAPFLLAQAFARQLAGDGPADIINLNDGRALRPGADHFAYTVTKVGLHGLTRSLALALAPRVRVNELALGAVLPPEAPKGGYVRTPREALPLRRFPSPDDVADAMLFLLSAPAVTGQTVSIDGGQHLGPWLQTGE
jgi:NAD(P)-dependent dehydrogenase (short-subunit alcohol dehydrogenase family)